MKLLKLFFVFIIFAVEASDQTRSDYLELIQLHPHLIVPKGDASLGEIEIVTDPTRMAAIEQKMKRQVGLIARDRYWIWINDAVVFPGGNEGIYGRIIWVTSLAGDTGVAVMPILPDGKIVLNCNFRHATRSWEIELPRGRLHPGETIEHGARREAHEETGMVVDTLTLLGEIPPDTGLTSTVAPIFLAQVVERQKNHQDESEAIEEILALSREELVTAFRQGYYVCKIRGEERRVNVRDPFLAFALLKSAKEQP